MTLLGAAITDKGSLVEKVAMIGSGSKVRADTVAQMAEPTGFPARRAAVAAEKFLLTAGEESTFIRGFIESIMPMQGAMLLDFFRYSGRIFADPFSNLTERE